MTLRRPNAGKLEYVSDGLTLSSNVVYDDIDPNLNQPLVIKDPADGVRYSFQQEQGQKVVPKGELEKLLA